LLENLSHNPCRPIGKRSRTSLVALLCLAFISIGISAEGARPQDISAKRVLVLHSYYQGYKWTDDENGGIESVLKPVVGRNNIHIEYMDTKKIFGDLYSQRLYEVYKLKYKNYRFDIIITTDNNAFEFMKKYRDRLFPGTPVVFCGVNYFRQDQIKDRKLFTGVNEENDLTGFVEMILKLHPTTRQIVFINEWTATGRGVHEALLKTIPLFEKSIKFLLLEDVNIEEILGPLQVLPPGSVVIYTAFSRDKSGKTFDHSEIVSRIARYCNSPIYTTNDFNLGHGVVGGMVVRGHDQGKAAGELALRILQGEHAETIPVIMDSPKQFVFDYLQMQRFAMSLSSLPPGSVVINQPETLYYRYKTWIYGVVITIAILLFIISVLLISIQRRKQTEKELENSQEQLRSLAWRLSNAQETERKMISRELHDRIGQNMTILGVNLNIMRSLAPENAGSLVESRINDSLALVKQTTERIRHLMGDLRSPVLDDYGLVAAIDLYGKQCAQRAGINIIVQAVEADPRLSPSVESTVFRIVQEALTNVVKHARATQAVISAGVTDGRFHLSVEDDGIGYDVAQSAGNEGRRGWGLVTMSERALAVGGTCRVRSHPGLGTHVVVEVPA
jgi:signal transduction histidine kinase